MLEQSDAPLKQKSANMLNPLELKHNTNYNQRIRKVRFKNFIFRLNLIEEFR